MCLTKFIKLPAVEAGQRQKILQFEAAQNIPYTLAEVVWESVVVNETPAGLEVLLAAAKFEMLDLLLRGGPASRIRARVDRAVVVRHAGGIQTAGGKRWRG